MLPSLPALRLSALFLALAGLGAAESHNHSAATPHTHFAPTAKPAAPPAAHAAHAEPAHAPAAEPAKAPATGGHEPGDAVNVSAPFQLFQRLMAGNTRFVAGVPEHPHQDASTRAQLAKGQKPFAIVLACADSRVAPEVLFDQGLGDLFVLRVAGNIANDDIKASIEYAVEHLGSGLIVVLGHERCGAVKAAVAGGELPGHLPGLIEKIRPAVEKVKGLPGDGLDNAIAVNARMVAQQLRDSAPLLKAKVDSGALTVLAMRYDLDTGAVDVLW